jgi:DNA-binding MarR family transcriptional regulator
LQKKKRVYTPILCIEVLRRVCLQPPGFIRLAKKKVGRETRDDDHYGVLRNAARRATEFYDGFLSASGLTTTQLFLIFVVRELREGSINDIASRMGVNRTTVAKCLRGLKTAEFVQIRKSANDRRAFAVIITGEGVRALETAIPLWRRAQAAFDKSNGPGSGRRLRATLESIQWEDIPPDILLD